MEIYLVKQNYDFKDLLFAEDNDSAERTLNFRGQSLKNDWKPLSLFTFQGKTKKEKAKREDFNASCFFQGCLFIRQDLKEVFSNFFKENIELLPVIVDLRENEFLFVNVLNTLEAIDFSKTNSPEEKMTMLRGNEINFSLKNIDNSIIFRDKTIYRFYYCTNKFIQFINENGIKGLSFEVAGQTN